MNFREMRWAITGGRGFIGRNLIRHLLWLGVRQKNITSIDLRQDHHQVGVSQTKVDIRDAAAIRGELADADIIIHLAAATSVQDSFDNPVHDHQTNVAGTKNVLDAAEAHGTKRLVFASSVAGFASKNAVNEETEPAPLSPYGAHKLAAEELCRNTGIPAVILRMTNVYGPDFADSKSILHQAIRSGLEGIPFELYGTGKTIRDFIHVNDACRAFVLAALSSDLPSEGCFQIASGQPVSITNALSIVDQQLALRGLGPLNIRTMKQRDGEIPVSFGDASKARKVLGWCPEIGLESGIGATIDWYRSHAM